MATSRHKFLPCIWHFSHDAQRFLEYIRLLMNHIYYKAIICFGGMGIEATPYFSHVLGDDGRFKVGDAAPLGASWQTGLTIHLYALPLYQGGKEHWK